MMKTNEVLETIKARRSVRVYDKKQVPSEDLNAILEAATYAPSGMHYETWHFTAVCNAAKLEEPQIRNPTKVSERCGPNRQECDFSSLD